MNTRGTITVEADVHFTNGQKGRKRAVAGEKPAPPPVPAGAVPRLSRLMALAIRFDKLIRDGVVKDYAELARLGQVTRARLTQITNLLNLAPDIQEEILFLPPVAGEREAISEREAGVSYQARAIARAILSTYLGEAEWVRPELPGKFEVGKDRLIPAAVDDFVVSRKGRRAYYQAKSNAPGGGTWTVSKLIRADILQSFQRQLQADSDAECQLLTPCDCPLLSNVAKRAREAVSLAEFLANLPKGQSRLLAEMRRHLGLADDQAYAMLGRCGLDRKSSEDLEEHLLAVAKTAFADPEVAVACLHSAAVQAMETGQQLDQTAIEEYTAGKSVFRAPKSPEADLLSSLHAASARLRNTPRDIGGIHIDRPETDEIVAWIAGAHPPTDRVAALVDEAGSGKTVATSVVLNRLEEAGYRVLGIKADGLSFSSHDELAKTLVLSDPVPSVVQRLSASGHRVAVLIDQVDALSAAMSRDSAAIATVLDLVSRLSGIEGVPILLACRSFDWRYDFHLRSLKDARLREFQLHELTDEQVEGVLAARSVRLQNLHPITRKLIRRPLMLKVLAEVIDGRREGRPSWSPSADTAYTIQALYEELWELKMSRAKHAGVSPAACEDLVGTVADSMHRRQELSVPAAAAARQRAEADWLVSEGILLPDGKRVTFFHQTFFDFVMARHCVQRGESLTARLLATDQGLFHRPMVRQVLEYLRDADRPQYLRELRALLTNPDVRRHIRRLTLVWLGQSSEPLAEELAVLEPMLADAEGRAQVLAALRRSPPWFDMLGTDRFRRWLDTLPDEQIDRVVSCLSDVAPKRQEQVASLLCPFVGKSEAWNNRIGFCLARPGAKWEGSAGALLLKLLKDPKTDLDAPGAWWIRALHRAAECGCPAAAEGIGAILTRWLFRWEAAGRPGYEPDPAKRLYHCLESPLFPRQDVFWEAVRQAADTVPRELLRAVLPWVRIVMDLSMTDGDENELRRNYAMWGLRGPHSLHDSDDVMHAIDKAATKLAEDDPAAFRGFVPELLRGDFHPMRCVVARAYASAPQTFDHDTAELLTADPRCLDLTADLTSGHLSSELIERCCPHWSDQDFREVEQAICSLRPRVRPARGQLQRRGWLQLLLLSVMDRKRLGQTGKNLLGQLERKFPDFRRPRHQDLRATWVGPPVPDSAIENMNDANWLEAMKHFVAEDTPWNGRRPIQLTGGRPQLSRALQARAKTEPERFWRLALEKMDETYHVDYAAAIVEGIAEAGAVPGNVDKLVRKFRRQLEAAHIRSVCHAFEKYAGKTFPESWISLLEHWAANARNPDRDERLDNRSLLDTGINTDRGHCFWTLAALLLKSDPPRRGDYLRTAKTAVGDLSTAVRAVAVHFLQYAIQAGPTEACDTFRRLVRDDAELLRERGTYDFVYYALHRHADKVLWAVDAMLADCDSQDALEAGAKLACLAAFECTDAEGLRDRCLTGTAPMRKGAAIIYASNLPIHEVAAECRRRLPVFWSDPNGEVRAAASGFWHRLSAADLRELDADLRAWGSSDAFPDGMEQAAKRLHGEPTANPPLTLEIAGRVIDTAGPAMADIATRHAMLSYYLVPAILNVYHHSGDAMLRGRAMDLFEELEEMGCYEIPKALEAADRL